ncbi:MAG: hypothetical protein ACNA8W_07860, partial [Bradymonadaceae bacterium]
TLCAIDGDELITTCEYLPEYACYDKAYTECGCFEGQCGWEQTDEFSACLADAGDDTDPTECEGPDPSIDCRTTGCDADKECRVDADGCRPSACGCNDGDWICTADCGEAYSCQDPQNSDAECTQNSECKVGGCSGTVCAINGDEIITTCEYLPEYACYDQEYTECGCFDGQCGWEETEEFNTCLDNGGPADDSCPAPRQTDEACIQVIAYATNPDGALCCEYPTPCAAPEDWTVTYDGCPS